MSVGTSQMEPAYVAAHAENDREHWWFRGRLAVLCAVLQRRLPPGRLRLVEFGCGTGNVLEALRPFGDPTGIEVDDTLRAIARARGLDVRAGALPDRVPIDPGTADVVLMLDVLEHLDAESAGLGAARKILVPGGLLVVTVPAYQWLWSAHDVHLGHRRRYTRARLRGAVEGAGLVVERVSYFNAALFPAVAAVRCAQRLARRDGHDLQRPAPAVNRALAAVFALERHVVSRVDMPFGSSLLLVARA